MTPFDRLFSIMTKPLVAISYLALVLVSYLYFDRPVALYFHELHFTTDLSLVNLLTKIGLTGIYLPLFLVLAVFFRYLRINRKFELRSWFLFLCVAIPALVCGILKVTFGRARPNLLFFDNEFGFYWFKLKAIYWSFPSGHTTTIMGAALGLGILFPRHFYAFILVGCSVAFSRIMLTQHYLSDVLTAFYLVILELGLLLFFLRRKPDLLPLPGITVRC